MHMVQVGTVVATGVFCVSFFSELMLKVFVCFFQVAKKDAEYNPGSLWSNIRNRQGFHQVAFFFNFGEF